MKYSLLFFLLFINSCAKKGSPQLVKESNDNFEVEKLFKKDKCSVYRFLDNGRYHYFTDCMETISDYSTTSTYPCGKNICYRTETHDENIK